MGIEIGGKHNRGSQIFKDIMVFRQYVNGEPALILVAKIKKQSNPAYIIGLSHAYKYVDASYMAIQAREAAKHIGLGDTLQSASNVADAIFYSIPDLLAMPPEPPTPGKHLGEGKLISEDGSEIDFELTDQEYAH